MQLYFKNKEVNFLLITEEIWGELKLVLILTKYRELSYPNR
jgi:hypothetical protein